MLGTATRSVPLRRRASIRENCRRGTGPMSRNRFKTKLWAGLILRCCRSCAQNASAARLGNFSHASPRICTLIFRKHKTLLLFIRNYVALCPIAHYPSAVWQTVLNLLPAGCSPLDSAGDEMGVLKFRVGDIFDSTNEK